MTYETIKIKVPALRVNEQLESISAAQDVIKLVKCNSLQEELHVIFMNTKHEKICDKIVAMGAGNTVMVTPREVFHIAISALATSIILVHNHPSGSPAPSDEDIKFTQRIKNAGDILGIQVLDHIIITRDPEVYYSFRREDII